MARSYTSLARKAGLIPSNGSATKKLMQLPTRRSKKRAELENLRVALDDMVARGELTKTQDGRYGLPLTA